MLPDAFDLLKSVWATVGPHFGSDKAPPRFWTHLKETFQEAWEMIEPAWNGEMDDWILLEESCRHVGLRIGGILLTLAVLFLNARVIERSCAKCAKCRPVRRWRERDLKTTCGNITLFRQEHDCACGTQSVPVDRALGLPPDDRVSPDLVLWSLKVGATLSYAASKRFFHDLTGQDVISAQGVHDQVATVGQILPEMNVVPPATTPGQLPAQVIADVDGAIVGLHHTAKPKTPKPAAPEATTEQASIKRKKRRRNVQFEVYVGRIYERHDVLLDGKMHVYKHLAFGGGVSRAGDDVPLVMFNLVNQRFPGAIPDRVVYVRGDGAQGIDTIAGKFPKKERLLDQYHTLVKVTERVKEAFPDLDPRKRRAIDDELSNLLRAGDATGMLEQLTLLEDHPTLRSKEPLQRLAFHIHKHRDHIWYPLAKEMGIGVGTGITEKDVDLVLDRRYELRGMSWTPIGIRNNLRVRLTLFNETSSNLAQAVRQRQPRP